MGKTSTQQGVYKVMKADPITGRIPITKRAEILAKALLYQRLSVVWSNRTDYFDRIMERDEEGGWIGHLAEAQAIIRWQNTIADSCMLDGYVTQADLDRWETNEEF